MLRLSLLLPLLLLLASASSRARPDCSEPAPGCAFNQRDQYLEAAAEDDADDHDYHVRPTRSVLRSPLEKEAAFWRDSALTLLRSKLAEQPILTRARNVVLFLGDGMSIPTLTAARILEGGESASLSFERFPYTGLSKTYCVDTQVADSACTSTAYLSGVKANTGTIGVTAAVSRSNCSAALDPNNRVTSILRWAQDAGKKTGVVTNTRVTHASPAGAYAHSASRNWESDRDVLKEKKDLEQCPDIAMQLVTGDTGKNINVVLGGGRREFRSYKVRDEEGDRGQRKDGRDLIKEWSADKTERGFNSTYVWDRKGLLQVDPDSTDFLLGLFESSHMQYHMKADPKKEPSLAEMTGAAIRLLSKEPRGFFLFVEGGKIDLAHHKSRARRALDETVEFAKAVQVALQLTNMEETLIVVTSDHSHTMSMSGYTSRGGDIFGFGGKSDVDGKPYTILNYANGPGYKPAEKDGSRYDLTNADLESDKFEYPSVVPRESETHGGDDVAVFARGPWAHLLTGSFEQSVIPYVMAYASCIGPQAKEGFCPPEVKSTPAAAPEAATAPAADPIASNKISSSSAPLATQPPSAAPEAASSVDKLS